MTVTLGTPYENVDGIDAASTNQFWLVELPDIDNKTVVFYITFDGADYSINARVINVSADAVSSIGAEQTLVGPTTEPIEDVWAEADTTTRILLTWKQTPSANEFRAAIATISGDTVSIGSAQTLDGGVHASEPVYGAWVNSSLIIGIFMDSALSDFYCVACTVSGSTISSPGTRVLIDTSMGTIPFNEYKVKGSGDGSRSLIFWNDVGNTQVRVAKITSGTTITLHAINSFLATTALTSSRLVKIPDDTTTFIAQWARGITPVPEAVHLTIDAGDDTIDVGVIESWFFGDADNGSGGLALLSANLALTLWTDGIGTPVGVVSEMDITGATLTVDETDDAELAKAPGSQIVKVGDNRVLVLYNDVDAVIATTDEITVVGSTGTYAIGLALDRESNQDDRARVAYVTIHRGANLYLQRYSITGSADMSLMGEVSLGAATLEAVQNGTTIAWPFAGSDTDVWVFGRMNNPAGAPTAGVRHILASSVGGTGSWADVPGVTGSWADDDVMASLYVTPDDTSRVYTAVRRRFGNAPELWRGVESLNLASVIPFPTGTATEYKGMHRSPGGEVSVGNAQIGEGSNRIVSSQSPHSTWRDITYDYGSGTVEVLRYF